MSAELRHVLPGKQHGPVTARFEDASFLRLLKYFPHLGEGKESSAAWSWIASEELVFRRRDGGEVVVYFDTDRRFWSEGHGDWELDPGFDAFLKQATME
ncbi:MAG: hypothetical protein WBD40_08235 [Tepidisphaeraceae bacterium]